MNKKEIEKAIKEKYSNNHGLRDGGTRGVREVIEGKNFIVFSVQHKGYNRGGVRNSGITIWEGWYAFNGMREITLFPMSMWRDGENYHNDRPWDRWIFKGIKGHTVTFENWIENPEERTFTLDFDAG